MIVPEILFEDLVIENRYYSFKSSFVSLDITGLCLTKEHITKDFNIEVEEVVFSSDKLYFENTEHTYLETKEYTELKSYNFFKDYFTPSVEKIPFSYKEYLLKYITEKSIYGKEARKHFYELCIENLKGIYISLRKVLHLNENEKDLISKQIAICQDFVGDLKLELENVKKIPFTLNNTELTTLFYLLRNYNVIDRKLTNPELGELMQSCLYYNSKKPLSKASKYLYSYDKKINEKTLSKLKDSFRDILFKK